MGGWASAGTVQKRPFSASFVPRARASGRSATSAAPLSTDCAAWAALETDAGRQGYLEELRSGGSATVDIARIFQPSVEEELWKRYYKGDQGVFLRHITKTLSRQKFEAIQKKYQTDDKFRSYVMRYLKEYSALIKHARATDRAEVLTTTFSTSDMGKLYMLLSKSMEAGVADQATG